MVTERMVVWCLECLLGCIGRGTTPDYICPFCCDRVHLVCLALSILQQVQHRGEEVIGCTGQRLGAPAGVK